MLRQLGEPEGRSEHLLAAPNHLDLRVPIAGEIRVYGFYRGGDYLEMGL